MSLWLSRMPHITQSRHGVWKYRRGIPESLRPYAGKREIVVSLGTKDERAAELRSLKVHQDAEAMLAAWKAQAVGVARSVASVAAEERSAVDDWYRGLDYLKAHGMAYRPYRKGMEDLEFTIREGIVTDQLGIDPHDLESREEELDRSPEGLPSP